MLNGKKRKTPHKTLTTPSSNTTQREKPAHRTKRRRIIENSESSERNTNNHATSTGTKKTTGTHVHQPKRKPGRPRTNNQNNQENSQKKDPLLELFSPPLPNLNQQADRFDWRRKFDEHCQQTGKLATSDEVLDGAFRATLAEIREPSDAHELLNQYLQMKETGTIEKLSPALSRPQATENGLVTKEAGAARFAQLSEDMLEDLQTDIDSGVLQYRAIAALVTQAKQTRNLAKEGSPIGEKPVPVSSGVIICVSL